MKKKRQILLVDDSKETVEGLGSYLSQNYEVHKVFNGLDAIKMIEQNRIGLDLVIIDLVMPDISGAALIKLIKSNSPETPIIAMTGWAKDPSEVASEAKADTVLIKPFELEELDKSISQLLPSKTS